MARERYEEEEEVDGAEQQEEESPEEGTLAAALQGEFKAAPWYMSSAAIHALVFLLLMLIPTDPPKKKTRQVVITSTIAEEEEKLEEPEPDIQEVDPVVTTETPVTEPTPIIVSSEFEVSDHNETDNNMDQATAQGDPECVTTFEGDVDGTPALMGVGKSGGGMGGGGRFGNRLGGGRKNCVARGGGSRRTESAVDWALRWLAEHQEADGHWDGKKYGVADHIVGSGGNDAGLTSMAVLAFLGAGNSTKFGKYKDNVSRAVHWLKGQNQGGCIGVHRYEGGLGLMAMAEAYGMSQDADLKAVAQGAVDYAVKTQCPSGGWDYAPNSQRVDTSVAGWWIMGLKSAKVSGLTVPHEAFDKALKYMEKATDPTTGTASYDTQAAPDVNAVKAGGGTYRMRSVALTCLQFLGKDRTDPVVMAAAKGASQADMLPKIEGKPDFYNWYYSALGIFQMGIRSDSWKAWNEPMKTALLGLQVKEGTFKENKGSWNFENDEYGKAWGRVGQTALGALMLEVYYRYDDIHRNPINKK